MKLSIVIPAFNEEKLIVASVRAVKLASAAFSARGWETQFIVCDNNSSDRTAELARAEGAEVVFEPINQISRARNRGAQAATGDWILWVDADSFASRELFADVAEAIASGRYIAGGALVNMENAPLDARMANWLWNTISRCMKWVAGSFVFCEAAAFREVGGFSVELFASEEIDLSKRLKRLAADRGKKMAILTRHSIATSARKLHLYSRREHWRLFIKALFRPSSTLTNREDCELWYDGRR